MAVTLTPLLHTTPYTRDFLRDANSQEARDDLRVYSTDEVDDLVAGIGGVTISDFIRGMLALPDDSSVRDYLGVYSTSEVYNINETYNTGEIYTKTETDQQIATAVNAITLVGGGTGSVVSVNGYTGIVVLAQSDISGLVSALATKATTVQLGLSFNQVNASITSNINTVNASILAVTTAQATVNAAKADNTTLSNYATTATVNALNTVVTTHTTQIAAASTRISVLEGAGTLLAESQFNNQSAMTVAASDAGKVIRTGAATIKFASNATVAIPTNSYGYIFRGSAAGAVTLQNLAGVTFVSPLNLTGIADQGGMVMWWKQGANTIVLSGDLG